MTAAGLAQPSRAWPRSWAPLHITHKPALCLLPVPQLCQHRVTPCTWLGLPAEQSRAAGWGGTRLSSCQQHRDRAGGVCLCLRGTWSCDAAWHGTAWHGTAWQPHLTRLLPQHPRAVSLLSLRRAGSQDGWFDWVEPSLAQLHTGSSPGSCRCAKGTVREVPGAAALQGKHGWVMLLQFCAGSALLWMPGLTLLCAGAAAAGRRLMCRGVCEVGFRVSWDKQMNPLGWGCAGGRKNARQYSPMPVHWTPFPGTILVAVLQKDPFGIAAASWGLSLY